MNPRKMSHSPQKKRKNPRHSQSNLRKRKNLMTRIMMRTISREEGEERR